MSHLIPTVITDVNGKTTTVHRRAETPSAGAKKLPVPGVATKPKEASTVTPLADPPPVSKGEAEAFFRKGRVDVGPRTTRHRNKITGRQSGRDTVALAKHMLDSGRITKHDASYIIDDEVTLLDCYNAYNTLLMFEHLRKIDSNYVSDDRMLICQVMHGLGQNNSKGRQPIPKITTQEELERYGAVVRFALEQDWSQHLLLGQQLPCGSDEISFSYAITSKRLEHLIQDYPQDTKRIASYLKERGVTKKHLKEQVEELRAWLNETRDTKAISDGWL